MTFKKEVNAKWSKLVFSAKAILVFFAIAHGYRFVNTILGHDTLYTFIQCDAYYQRSLGRFMQPVVWLVRGVICSPWLIAIGAILFFSLSLYFLADLFKINHKLTIALIAAVLLCNVTSINAAAAFLPWVDIYAGALFFAALGVWLLEQRKLCFTILGVGSFVISLGLYQAYICVALVLSLMLVVIRANDSDKVKEFLLYVARIAVSYVVAAIVYFVIMKLVMVVHHVEMSSSYNGLSSIGDYQGYSIGGLIAGTYRTFFRYFVEPKTFSNQYLLGQSMTLAWKYIVIVANIIVMLFLVAGIILLTKQKKTPKWVYGIDIAGIILLPMAANFVYFMSKGMEHNLMIYAFIMVYVMAIIIGDKVQSNLKFQELLIIVPIAIIVWCNVAFGNQIYQKLDLQQSATISTVTRIVKDIEDTEGYVPCKTPVVFGGVLANSPYISEMPDIARLELIGVSSSPITYQGTMEQYVRYVMNVNMVFGDSGAFMEDLAGMPVWPNDGAIIYKDGTVIVKLSE